jgi:hypothetical protein
LFKSTYTIVIDSKGGDRLRGYVDCYKYFLGKLSVARRMGIDMVNTEYTLNLDVDTFLPNGYIEKALEILQNNIDIQAVALDYDKPQGHLAFGTSLWRTKTLKEQYDWNEETKTCECLYMWNKINGKVATVPNMVALHLKYTKKVI